MSNFCEIYQTGEDVLRVAMESGNDSAARRAERFEAAQALLKATGALAGPVDVFRLLKEKIKFSTKETKIESADQVQKLLQTASRARDAKVWHQIKSNQYVDGAKTCFAKWTLLAKIAQITKTTEEYRFTVLNLVEGLCQKHASNIFELWWRVKPEDLTKDTMEEVVRTLCFKFHVPSSVNLGTHTGCYYSAFFIAFAVVSFHCVSFACV